MATMADTHTPPLYSLTFEAPVCVCVCSCTCLACSSSQQQHVLGINEYERHLSHLLIGGDICAACFPWGRRSGAAVSIVPPLPSKKVWGPGLGLWLSCADFACSPRFLSSPSSRSPKTCLLDECERSQHVAVV